ncbi:hypothetical protein EJB05_30032 [Eragrostis curvula]|uniref:Uncharacterized protein n=1 Tax=Eragrostis curvula TaxID=38414 RepID=A0A5J9UUI4_9POAL|nr:hypothetical protein EJB05_30032 [Eragrostis curvula]
MEEDLQLPDDMVANILGRLAPCSLAASRCVRKRWCAIIDTRRLLRADLLPLHLDGFFFLGAELGLDFGQTYFFSRPSAGRRICGHLHNLVDEHDDRWILDHCSGLLLLWERVVNPATRQWVALPPFPELSDSLFESYYLAYDPLASSPQHYEVLLFPTHRIQEEANNNRSSAECWPPSPFTMHVFSSRKWRWEERSFVREGTAIADMPRPADYSQEEQQLRHTVYLRGALYVLCQNDSVMRITMQNDRYQMIVSPAENKVGVAYLGKSQNQVYYVSLSEENRWPRFRVWLLNESYSRMEWALKNDISLQAMVENFPTDYTARYITPWILNYQKDVSQAWTENDPEWDFEGGIVLDETDDDNAITTCYKGIIFLGFHPYKEIAFFLVSFSRVVSYHLNSSKVQELGILNKGIVKSFPYTSCWVGELFENN